MAKIIPFVSKDKPKTSNPTCIPWDEMNPKFRKSIKFFYMRDEEKRPVMTECVIDLDFGTFKGWAIWNPDDIINKKEGRNQAYLRAVAVLSEFVLNRWNKNPSAFSLFPVNRPEVKDRMLKLGYFVTHKALGVPKTKKS